MEQRISIHESLPDSLKAMNTLSSSLAKSSLTASQNHLIKIRASQINSCAFCINMHTKEALQTGETQQRLFLISAWRETSVFSDDEKMILELTEAVTLIHEHGVSDVLYNHARKFFSAETISHIFMTAVVINAWNRIAVSTHMPI